MRPGWQPSQRDPIDQAHRGIAAVPIDDIQATVVLRQSQPINHRYAEQATNNCPTDAAMRDERYLAALMSLK